MTHRQRFVGIDVSSRRLDVHCLPDGDSFSEANTADGIARLIARLGRSGWVAACEATGGYEDRLLIAFQEAGHDIWCLHPTDVRAFARLTGRRAKTDRLDARVIAGALAAAKASRKPLRRTRAQSDLRQLMILRRHLMATLQELKSLAACMTNPAAAELIAVRIAAAKADLGGLERRIARSIADDPEASARARLVRSVPGAGKVLACEVLSAMPELGAISAKQAASLAGVAPHPRQSGNTQRNGRCQGGRFHLRRCLYMAALSAIKVRARSLYPLYSRLRKTGKPFKVAIVACMRKLITQINAVLRNQTPFNINQNPTEPTVA